MTRQTHLRYFYLLNSLAATFCWVYFLSDGFHAAGLLDGVYDLQAHALAHFHLAIEPGPSQNFYFDIGLYNGKYYYYQGLLPAILHAGLTKILGRVLSSYLIASGFLFCFAYFFQRIIGDIVEKSLKSADSFKFWLLLGSLPLLWLFLFNLPFPFNEYTWFFGRFAIYEQQIIFGLSIMMPAIFLLMRGLASQNEQLLCIAGFLCSLAAWTRITWLVFAAMVIIIIYMYSARSRNGRFFSIASRKVILWQTASVVLLAGLLVLNFIRFDSLFEFGQKYLNPMHYIYLRSIVGHFSPTTRFWNFVFNILVYYGSPDLVKGLGLIGKSSSFWEIMPVSYFHFNPQFLPIFVLIPLGLYKAFRKNRDLFLMMVCVGLTAIYMNLLITVAGPVVIFRYFIEFYYFVLLLFFMVIVMLIPYRFALPAIILLLCVSLPGNFKAFTAFKPELRLVDPDKNLQVIVDATQPKMPKTPFIEKNAVWFQQTVSYPNRGSFKKYNSIGAYPASGEMILCTDLAALYIVPGKDSGDICAKNALIIKNLKSLVEDGIVRFYADGYHIGDLNVNIKTSVNGCFPLKDRIQRKAPYQILMVFIPKDREFLSPRAVKRPIFKFKEISLQAG